MCGTGILSIAYNTIATKKYTLFLERRKLRGINANFPLCDTSEKYVVVYQVVIVLRICVTVL